MLTDPAHDVTGCELSPDGLRSRHMKGVVDTGIRVGEASGPIRADRLRGKREDTHADGDVQGHHPKRHTPGPPSTRSVGILTGDHLSAGMSAVDSGGPSRRASASQRASAAMTSAAMAEAVTMRINDPEAPWSVRKP